MKKYLLSLDEGTTSARAILFDKNGDTVGTAQCEFPQSYPQPGWVEQDAANIYAVQMSVVVEVIEKCGISVGEIAAIGITNQRETTVVWERATGKPVCPAIGWQCRRTAPFCEELIRQGKTDMIRAKTGLPVDAYFSATKLKWILDNVPGVRERAEAGELCFGTIDSYLLFRMTEGRVHATDRTNASRTMLYNIHTFDWDDELCSLFEIPRCMLPQVLPSSAPFGSVILRGTEIPVTGVAGDQQAALFGQCCFAPGEGKNTYGTGCFLLVNTGSVPTTSRAGLITTVAASRQGEAPAYALEGSVFIGGAVIQWLRDEMQLIKEARDSEVFASEIADCGGVFFVPAFSGLGAPYWDMNARGILTGITRGTDRRHIIRAALESIAYQTNDILRAMEKDTAAPFQILRADGGASANRLLMQFQADISGVDVTVPTNGEATAKGAAFLAGLGAGFYRDTDELRALPSPCNVYRPKMEKDVRQQLIEGWLHAVDQARR